MSLDTPPTPPMVRADPELVRLAIALGHSGSIRLWLLLRDLTRQAQGSGKIARTALSEAVRYTGIEISPRQLRRLLRDGEGHFWQGSSSHLYLVSYQKVAAWLTEQALDGSQSDLVLSNRPGVRDMYLPLAGSLARFKAQAYAAWLAARGGVTISRACLERLWGCSAQTLRNWETQLPQLEKRANYAQCPDGERQRQHVPDHAYAYLARTEKGLEQRLTWQIPNSYIPHAIRQHPRRGQSRRVRCAVNHLIGSSAGERPASLSHGGQRSRCYWADPTRFRRHARQRGFARPVYVWLGENRYGYGLWDYRKSGDHQTALNERLPLRQEYGLFAGQGGRVTGWEVQALMCGQKFESHPASRGPAPYSFLSEAVERREERLLHRQLRGICRQHYLPGFE